MMNENTNINGKVVVITGASSGLGEATARHLSAEGATVVLGARRTERCNALLRLDSTPGEWVWYAKLAWPPCSHHAARH